LTETAADAAEANLTAADTGKLLAHGVATCMILEL
jgi:acyl-coenzyme A thioesterase PaaI-like protein